MSRRSTRTPAAAGLYPPQFQECVNKVDSYARSNNLKPMLMNMRNLESSQLEGIKLRLIRNHSFIKTEANPSPHVFPQHLQQVDLSAKKIEQLLDSLAESHGILVALIQPPPGIDYRTFSPEADEDSSLASPCRPLCGVLIRLSDLNEDEDFHDERSIVGAFCRRGVPEEVAAELMRVTLARAVCESLCYEEALEKENNPRKSGESPSKSVAIQKRFVSMDVSQLPLCPNVLMKCLMELKFDLHWDLVDNSRPFPHEGDSKECSCNKKYRKDEGKGLNYYQFFNLPFKRVKPYLPGTIPEDASPAVQEYCLQDVDKRKRIDSQEEEQQPTPPKKRKLSQS